VAGPAEEVQNAVDAAVVAVVLGAGMDAQQSVDTKVSKLAT